MSPRGEFDPYTIRHARWRKLPIVWTYQRLLSHRFVFHSTCDAETEYIRGQFKHPARVIQIPNYLEVPELVERVPEKYFLFIGRLNFKKGIENLIEAVALSKEFASSGFKLKIAGRGESDYTDMLRRKVEELGLAGKVEFIGQVEGKEKLQLFANAHWTFMPSYTENFGMVVLESLAQNTPVLASTNSPWQILEDEKVGYWVDNSPETLGKMIDKIIVMSADEYEAYRRQGRAFVEKNFDIKNNISRWTDFYSSLTDK